MIYYDPIKQERMAEGSAFKLNDIQYPANWLSLASEQDANGIGLFQIEDLPYPAYDPITQGVNALPLVQVGNRYQQGWQVYSLSPEQIAANKAAAAKALQDSIVQQTQARLDTFAQTRQYDGILSACTYATSPTPKFAAEGQYCVAQRDATWAKLYEIMAEVQAGTRPVPSSFADIEPELPTLTWPV